jgi:hypothetical protein
LYVLWFSVIRGDSYELYFLSNCLNHKLNLIHPIIYNSYNKLYIQIHLFPFISSKIMYSIAKFSHTKDNSIAKFSHTKDTTQMNTTKRYTEISHFSHPKHKLTFQYSEFPFKCDGCKEIGIGSRYNCNICDYDLHMHCSIPSPSLFHPFYPKCCFQFLSKPPGDIPRYCNACEKSVTGFVYHCFSCGFDLHPCCAKLPMILDDHGEVKLYLYRKVSSSCQRCGQKGRSWSYR